MSSPARDAEHTLEYWKDRAKRLEAALRTVRQWSIMTATDLTAADYDRWAELLDGPRKTGHQILGDLKDVLHLAHGQRRPGHDG